MSAERMALHRCSQPGGLRNCMSIADKRPAVHDKVVPIDEGSGRGGKENGRARDFFRTPGTPQWRPLQAKGEIVFVLKDGRRKGGLDQARRDGVHADVVRPPFDRQIARQLRIRCLGDAVSANTPVAAKPGDAGDYDHRAVAPGRHLRNEQAAEIEHAADVDAHHAVEGVIADFRQRPFMRVDACVADENVDSARLP